MKKAFVLMSCVMLSMALLFAGCKKASENEAGAAGGKGAAKGDAPKVVVEKFFKAMFNADKEAAKPLCTESFAEKAGIDKLNSEDKAPEEVVKTFKVLGEKIEGNKAIVEFELEGGADDLELVNEKGKWLIVGGGPKHKKKMEEYEKKMEEHKKKMAELDAELDAELKALEEEGKKLEKKAEAEMKKTEKK